MFSQYPTQYYPLVYPRDLSFDRYRDLCQQMIETYRIDLDGPNRETILTANCPYEFIPEKTSADVGVLLVHGLLDSPFLMRDIGHYLQANEIWVRSILLPGHGTQPEHLSQVDYEAWASSVDHAIKAFAPCVKKLFLIGYSTGGALAIHQALRDTTPLKGIGVIAPALKINTAFNFMMTSYHKLTRLYPRAEWLRRGTENDYSRYYSICFNAAYQVYRLAKAIPHDVPLPCPLFMVLAENDQTISSKVALQYFKKQYQPHNQCILYSNRKDFDHATHVILRNSEYPEWSIRDFSHVGLTSAPENAHYGQYGDYLYASRIDKKNVLYGLGDNIGTGFKSKMPLTYNPDFNFMATELRSFIFTHAQ